MQRFLYSRDLDLKIPMLIKNMLATRARLFLEEKKKNMSWLLLCSADLLVIKVKVFQFVGAVLWIC